MWPDDRVTSNNYTVPVTPDAQIFKSHLPCEQRQWTVTKQVSFHLQGEIDVTGFRNHTGAEYSSLMHSNSVEYLIQTKQRDGECLLALFYVTDHVPSCRWQLLDVIYSPLIGFTPRCCNAFWIQSISDFCHGDICDYNWWVLLCNVQNINLSNCAQDWHFQKT